MSEEKTETVVGRVYPLSEPERRAEIDMRIGTKLLEREMFRAEYTKGFCDALYVMIFLASIIYVLYVSWNREE